MIKHLSIVVGLWFSVAYSQGVVMNQQYNIGTAGINGIGTDVVFDPLIDGSAAVKITTSNVIFDLNNHMVSFSSTNTCVAINGIEIASGLSNVTIKNGHISGFSGKGIIVKDGCSDIVIEHLKVDSCLQGGIDFVGTTSDGIEAITLFDCTVNGCNGSSEQEACGVSIAYGTNIKIANCLFEDNSATTTTVDGYGLVLDHCECCRIVKTHAIGNGGNTIGAGFYCSYTNDCMVIECTALHNKAYSSSSGSTAYGFFFDTCSYVFCDLCQSISTVHVQKAAAGFRFNAGSFNQLYRCIAAKNRGYSSVAGFVADGGESGLSMTQCSSKGNYSENGVSRGVYLDSAILCEIANNIFSLNNGTTGYGLEDSTLNTSNFIFSNIAFANTTDAYKVTRNDGTALPKVSATVGDFSSSNTKSSLYNIAMAVESGGSGLLGLLF